MLRKTTKVIGWFLGVVLLLLAGLIVYARFFTVMTPPVTNASAMLDLPVIETDSGLFILGNNWFRKSESGLYELYVEGEPYELGVANGKLTKDLVEYQEQFFTSQLKRLVTSESYRDVLKYGVAMYNRNLDKDVSNEYLLEIYGVSRSASHKFDTIGNAYQRILNYHAAHDIGHALQNISLVGCTSFATWGDRSKDNTLIVGRNFDFYLGDDFARDKIIAFYNPSRGHKFMMVTFGGMTGVLSGMNVEGLTVTLNAAKSKFPLSSATPVSLVAREILQYASTLKEAYAIAEKRNMFVSESFLIGSAKDGKASVIEKTPEDIDLYESPEHYIISTNHFQGERLGNTQINKDHVRQSASLYRYNRVKQLLDRNPVNSVNITAGILRDQRGLNDKSIGLGNEKAINQLVAHHGIIFQPEKGLVWISTAPWQLGKFVCYDLKKVFNEKMTSNHEVYEETLMIPMDSFTTTSQYQDYLKFSPYRFPFNFQPAFHADSVVKWNPDSYQSYMMAADYYREHSQFVRAAWLYQIGLTKEVATFQEEEYMKKNLLFCKEKIGNQ